MLVNLRKTVKTIDELHILVFEREIKIPIEPVIGMSIRGLEEEDSDDSVNHIVYNQYSKKLILIIEDSYFNPQDIESVEVIKNRHSKWQLIDQIPYPEY